LSTGPSELLLDPDAQYYSDWSGGSAGAVAGDIEIDDVFSSAYLTATATFDSAESLTNDLGVLPIGIITFGPITFEDEVVDPIVINLAGQPVTTTAEGANGVTFDMLGNGSQQNTGWVTSDEGFLVFDKTQASQIVSSHDMISDLNELASFDSNGDGKITAADALFNDLEVWIPGTQGGPGILETLTQAGITELDLSATTANQMNNGNTINATFSFKFANGTIGQGADVSFSVGPDTTTPVPAAAASSQSNSALVQAMASFNPAPPLNAPPAYQIPSAPEVALATAH
jgi:hypothetical protein